MLVLVSMTCIYWGQVFASTKFWTYYTTDYVILVFHITTRKSQERTVYVRAISPGPFVGRLPLASRI